MSSCRYATSRCVCFLGPRDLLADCLVLAQIINQVAAASIGTKLDCDAFAQTHSATSHYDRVRRVQNSTTLSMLSHSLVYPSQASFVGLAWRPPSEFICCGTLQFCDCLSFATVKRDLLVVEDEFYSGPSVAHFHPPPLRAEIYSTGCALSNKDPQCAHLMCVVCC